jgi:undecaprenyl-diphosphatase
MRYDAARRSLPTAQLPYHARPYHDPSGPAIAFMDNLLQVIVLGLIEGITEFLPISSTGHLLIAEYWLGPRSDLFNIAIQAGAILAVVLVYRQRLVDLLLTNFGVAANRDYLLKLLLAFAVTSVGGLLVKQFGFELPEELTPIAWASLLGGIAILVVEFIVVKRPPSSYVTWNVAVWVGVCQILAGVFPGTSRSAATIFAAMLAGTTARPAAAEFAFLVGIPTMFAATAYELLRTVRAGGAQSVDWLSLGVGFVVSAVVAFVVVKWLLRYIQTHRFTIFAWYRIVLGAVLLAVVGR